MVCGGREPRLDEPHSRLSLIHQLFQGAHGLGVPGLLGDKVTVDRLERRVQPPRRIAEASLGSSRGTPFGPSSQVRGIVCPRGGMPLYARESGRESESISASSRATASEYGIK